MTDTREPRPGGEVVVYEAPNGEGELEREATFVRFATVRREGGRRQWATRRLREHLVSGYTLNRQRLAERGLREARDTLDLLARTLRNQALVEDTGRAVLDGQLIDMIGNIRVGDAWSRRRMTASRSRTK